jgi:hypothetical protein
MFLQERIMPGQFNTDPSQDGGDAFTTSSATNGIFAHNDATSSAPAGVPGGNGVFGLSTVPNASGVFGAHNSGGTGVFGNSDKGDGVRGRTGASDKNGLIAGNDGTTPAPAGVPGGNGVFGYSAVPNASGVFGAHNNGGTGVFGNSDKGDGVRGRTGASDKNGLIAGNDGTTPAPAGVPGGNGVFGYSTVPNASGVFGAHNNGGTGVFGNSDKGDGVRGRTGASDKNGLIAGNDGTSPAPAGVPAGNGVFGYSTVPNASGVVGAHNNGGTGVFGLSQNGIGIHGAGKVAGQFDGNVEVMGDLRLNGASFSDLLRRVATLEQEVARLIGNPPAPSTKPSINVSSRGSGSGAQFTVTGSGFLPNKTVTVRVVDAAFNMSSFQQSSDASGNITANLSIPCSSASPLHFSATDGRPDPSDLTGVLWSNTFMIPCP